MFSESQLSHELTQRSVDSCISDPLVHHGHYFGRTLHAMTNIQTLLTNGILRMGELADQPDETFTAESFTSFVDK